MNGFKCLMVVGVCLLAATFKTEAQVSINIGVEPACPYGYYGPDWYSNGVFIGAGPWFHGHHGFYGHVDNRYDPHHGYAGPMPARGEQPYNHFHANEARDGQGHVGNAGHDGANEHSAGAQGNNHGGGGQGNNHGGGGGQHR